MHAQVLHHVQLFVTLWAVAHQASLSMGFSRQQYWSGLPCPPSWDLPNSGIEPTSLMSPALAGEFFTTSATWEAHLLSYVTLNVDFAEIIGVYSHVSFTCVYSSLSTRYFKTHCIYCSLCIRYLKPTIFLQAS